MARALHILGVLVLVLGLATAGVAGWRLAADTSFAEAAAAYARHPEHELFQRDYWLAAAYHYELIAATVMGLLVGLSLGGILLALGELLRRVPRR